LEQKQRTKIEKLDAMWECISRHFTHGTKTNIRERAIKLIEKENIQIHEALYKASEEICVGKKKKYGKTKYDIFSIVEQCEQKRI